MRTYERTHPWLRFALDLTELDHLTWLLLGEAASKVEHIAGVPLEPEAARRLHALYLAKGVLATTAIEGNTLTEEEVRDLLAGRRELPPSRQYLAQEVRNVEAACNRIGEEVIRGTREPISPGEIREYNRLVLEKLPLDEDVVPGELRQHSVMVGRYRGAPAEDCEFLLAKFCDWLNGLAFPKDIERAGPILAAIAAHLHFVWIHPFGDGNGRTARLIEFRLLLQGGFPTPAAHLLSNFYNLTRTEYYRQLDKAGRAEGRMSEFVAYACQGLVDQLKEQLEFIRERQLDSVWENYVYKRFGREKETAARARRTRLVLDLSRVTEDNGWVPISKIPTLTPKLAQAYAGKTTKTLTRDLNAVARMAIIQQGHRSVRTNKHLIRAWLPARASKETGRPSEGKSQG